MKFTNNFVLSLLQLRSFGTMTQSSILVEKAAQCVKLDIMEGLLAQLCTALQNWDRNQFRRKPRDLEAARLRIYIASIFNVRCPGGSETRANGDARCYSVAPYLRPDLANCTALAACKMVIAYAFRGENHSPQLISANRENNNERLNGRGGEIFLGGHARGASCPCISTPKSSVTAKFPSTRMLWLYVQ